MKMRLLFGGLLVGVAIGLMLGGALVKIPTDGSGKRQYPQGIALLLTLVGAVGVGAHSAIPQQLHLAGNEAECSIVSAEQIDAPERANKPVLKWKVTRAR